LGHIWVSNTNGASWNLTFTSNMASDFNTINSTDNGTVLVLSGSIRGGGMAQGRRVIRSSNYGNTFSEVSTESSKLFSNAISNITAMKGANTGVWMAIDDLAWIYRSKDDGNTWVTLNSTNAFSTVNTQTGVDAYSAYGTDIAHIEGNTWLVSILYVSNNVISLANTFGNGTNKLILTTNDGEDWSEITSKTYRSPQQNVGTLAVDKTTGNIYIGQSAYAAGGIGILKPTVGMLNSELYSYMRVE